MNIENTLFSDIANPTARAFAEILAGFVTGQPVPPVETEEYDRMQALLLGAAEKLGEPDIRALGFAAIKVVLMHVQGGLMVQRLVLEQKQDIARGGRLQ